MENSALTQKHHPKNHYSSGSRPPPSPTTRSEPNPTTFVQADTSSFKKVVQMLTGSSETTRTETARSGMPPIRKGKPSSKLYERRNALKNFVISPLGPGTARAGGYSGSPRPGLLSPSILDFPALVLSPRTPVLPKPVDREAAEEKAIREKGFYLHPSPASTPRESVPRLLELFPVGVADD